MRQSTLSIRSHAGYYVKCITHMRHQWRVKLSLSFGFILYDCLRHSAHGLEGLNILSSPVASLQKDTPTHSNTHRLWKLSLSYGIQALLSKLHCCWYVAQPSSYESCSSYHLNQTAKKKKHEKTTTKNMSDIIDGYETHAVQSSLRTHSQDIS